MGFRDYEVSMRYIHTRSRIEEFNNYVVNLAQLTLDLPAVLSLDSDGRLTRDLFNPIKRQTGTENQDGTY